MAKTWFLPCCYVQRREVCFVPKGEKEPIFVPWEDLVAWVTEARGVTEYGVQRQYGFGFGFFHPDTGEKYSLEFETYGLPQAISDWEAIRAYMEYEVHTLKEIQDPLEFQGPDDPPWQGVHAFRNALNDSTSNSGTAKPAFSFLSAGTCST